MVATKLVPEPNWAVAPDAKFVPVIVTPVPDGPQLGATSVTVGGAPPGLVTSPGGARSSRSPTGK